MQLPQRPSLTLYMLVPSGEISHLDDLICSLSYILGNNISIYHEVTAPQARLTWGYPLSRGAEIQFVFGGLRVIQSLARCPKQTLWLKPNVCFHPGSCKCLWLKREIWEPRCFCNLAHPNLVLGELTHLPANCWRGWFLNCCCLCRQFKERRRQWESERSPGWATPSTRTHTYIYTQTHTHTDLRLLPITGHCNMWKCWLLNDWW